LSKLHLTEVPARVAALVGLTELDLRNNYLRELPEWLADLSLTDLGLGENRLRHLPASMAGLTRLRRLDLDSNRLTELPHWLSELAVAGNPLISPPPEILAGGSRSVLEFLRERAQGSEAQWVSKLLVVGEGGVGKTSLVKALAEDPHNPVEPSTHGLMIRAWSWITRTGQTCGCG
jgi:hypothetical protein